MVYDIVQRTSLDNLRSAVEKWLKVGWEPLGGPVFDQRFWVQAVTRSIRPMSGPGKNPPLIM